MNAPPTKGQLDKKNISGGPFNYPPKSAYPLHIKDEDQMRYQNT